MDKFFVFIRIFFYFNTDPVFSSNLHSRPLDPPYFALSARRCFLSRPTDGSSHNFVEAVDLISIMQAKARRFLAKQSALAWTS
jgi:hypothetical protein